MKSWQRSYSTTQSCRPGHTKTWCQINLASSSSVVWRIYYDFHGKDAAEVRQRFLDKISEYFFTIQIVNRHPATLKTLGAKLPGKETLEISEDDRSRSE